MPTGIRCGSPRRPAELVAARHQAQPRAQRSHRIHLPRQAGRCPPGVEVDAIDGTRQVGGRGRVGMSVLRRVQRDDQRLGGRWRHADIHPRDAEHRRAPAEDGVRVAPGQEVELPMEVDQRRRSRVGGCVARSLLGTPGGQLLRIAERIEDLPGPGDGGVQNEQIDVAVGPLRRVVVEPGGDRRPLIRSGSTPCSRSASTASARAASSARVWTTGLSNQLGEGVRRGEPLTRATRWPAGSLTRAYASAPRMMGQTPDAGRRVMFFAERFWPMVGGVEVQSLRLLRALADRGHEVIVVTGIGDGSLPHSETLDGSRYIASRSPRRSATATSMPWRRPVRQLPRSQASSSRSCCTRRSRGRASWRCRRPRSRRSRGR